MNLRFYSLLLFVMFITQLIQSQENFLPGYIVNLKGDTLYGIIDYQNWISNPKSIRFKTDNDQNANIFEPMDLMAFKVKTDVYVSAKVRLETSPLRIDEIQEGADLHFIDDTVFLQTLVQGSKSLYVYYGIKDKDQFFIKQDSSFELLLYKKYVTFDLSMRNVRELKKYVGQLIVYLSDCPTLFHKINQVSYKRGSLTSLFMKYLEESNQPIDYQKKAEKYMVKSGLVGGIALNTLRFSSSTYAELVHANYEPSTSMTPGFFIEFIQARNQHKWSSYNEFLYAPTHFKGYYEDPLYRYYTVFHLNYLKMTNLVRYQLPLKNIHLFINGGMSNGYFFGEKNYKRSESKIYDDRILIEKALDEGIVHISV